ncbi:agouti signaling protein 1 [Paramormyrops kingsleyae]|uniref:Agouti-signaling protein n=1 Tax=Paramormyrops kingsleyae TaxID=1676925 RepID=A0A3B3RMQ0_9TELE|nr:agouti-signaling protein [Paramormyrops kingsleyae]
MSAKCLLLSLILASVSFLMLYAHMILEEKPVSNGSSSASLQEQTHSDPPPVLIVELPKTVNKKPDKKQKKNKFSTKTKRPPPPANCVPLWGSCKTPNSMCCEYCAFCQCRLFKTVCYCRIGNPRC